MFIVLKSSYLEHEKKRFYAPVIYQDISSLFIVKLILSAHVFRSINSWH